jgi:hypothetical protein
MRAGARHQRFLPAGRDVDQPDAGPEAIGHHVRAHPDIGDAPAVGADLRIGRVGDVEQVAAGKGGGGKGCRGRDLLLRCLGEEGAPPRWPETSLIFSLNYHITT